MDKFSVCIAGAGVVGLAIARELTQSSSFQASSIVLLERESQFGQHISSRHSEVIHAGIYYPPASLKAKLCRRGRDLLYSYCSTYDIAYKKLGKCIISLEESADSLENLLANASANEVLDLEYWSQAELQQQEPAVSARHALFSPSTGIIDSHGYMQSLLAQAEIAGLVYAPRTEALTVSQEHDGFAVHTTLHETGGQESYSFKTEVFINCTGLQAQSLAQRIEGVAAASVPTLYPCKGDYFRYSGRNPFQHLIYPLPEPNTAGLGIHSTQDLSGQLRFGPDVDYVESIDYAVAAEKAEQFAAAIGHYFPGINSKQLVPDYAGIRPKLAGPGEPAADFVIQDEDDHGVAGLIQLFGIESPGLTSSLAIAEYVKGML